MTPRSRGSWKQDARRSSAPTRREHALLLRRQVARCARGQARAACARRWRGGSRHRDRAASDHRGRGRLAGRADREQPSGARARGAAGAAEPDRHQGRPGAARDFQQSADGDRRADGGGAAEHRLFGQHQGAARLLLRGVRRHRRAGRQCAAHAGASRLHGSRGRDRHPRERGRRSRRATSSPSTRPTTAAPTCPTSPYARRCSTTPAADILFWVASRGHHADIGGISPGSMSPNATTIEQEGVYIDKLKLVDRGRFCEAEVHRPPHRRQISGAQSAPEHRRSQGADRRQPEGRARAAQDGGAVRPPGGRGLYAARAGQRGRERAPRHRRACTIAPSPTRWTRAPGSR